MFQAKDSWNTLKAGSPTVWPVGRVGGELPTEEEDEAHQQGRKKTPLEPDSPLTSWEILSKFLDLSEPTPYPKNRNDNLLPFPEFPESQGAHTANACRQ